MTTKEVSGKVVYTVTVKDNVSYRLLDSTGTLLLLVPPFKGSVAFQYYCSASIYNHIHKGGYACISGPMKQSLSRNFACGPPSVFFFWEIFFLTYSSSLLNVTSTLCSSNPSTLFEVKLNCCIEISEISGS